MSVESNKADSNSPFGQVKRGRNKSVTFLGVPLQGWAIFAISLVAVLYAASDAFLSLQAKYNAIKIEVGTLQKKTGVLQKSVDIATQATQQKISEAERHKQLRDPSATIAIDTSAGHPVMAQYYPSDGCLHVTRTHGQPNSYGISDTQDLWIPDPSRQQVASTRKLRDPYNYATGSIQAPVPRPRGVMLKRASFNAVDESPRLQRVQSGCLNPHPWPFRTWWGPANGCFAPLYRQWNDGCVHYQVYNACSGVWDPGVYWTFCAPQHHP